MIWSFSTVGIPQKSPILFFEMSFINHPCLSIFGVPSPFKKAPSPSACHQVPVNRFGIAEATPEAGLQLFGGWCHWVEGKQRGKTHQNIDVGTLFGGQTVIKQSANSRILVYPAVITKGRFIFYVQASQWDGDTPWTNELIWFQDGWNHQTVMLELTMIEFCWHWGPKNHQEPALFLVRMVRIIRI